MGTFERVEQLVRQGIEEARRHGHASVDADGPFFALRARQRSNFGDGHVAPAERDELAFLHSVQIFGEVCLGLSNIDSDYGPILGQLVGHIQWIEVGH